MGSYPPPMKLGSPRQDLAALEFAWQRSSQLPEIKAKYEAVKQELERKIAASSGVPKLPTSRR